MALIDKFFSRKKTLSELDRQELRKEEILLTKQRDRLYVFTRDSEDPEQLVSQGLDGGEVLDLVRSLAAPDADSDRDLRPNAAPSPSRRIARIRTTIMRRLRRQ